jgi:hypothetical protein
MWGNKIPPQSPIPPNDSHFFDLEAPFERWVTADKSKEGKTMRINALIACGLAFVALGILLCYLMVSFALSYQGPAPNNGGTVSRAGFLFLFPFFVGGFFLYLARKFRRSLAPIN